MLALIAGVMRRRQKPARKFPRIRWISQSVSRKPSISEIVASPSVIHAPLSSPDTSFAWGHPQQIKDVSW